MLVFFVCPSKARLRLSLRKAQGRRAQPAKRSRTNCILRRRGAHRAPVLAFDFTANHIETCAAARRPPQSRFACQLPERGAKGRAAARGLLQSRPAAVPAPSEREPRALRRGGGRSMSAPTACDGRQCGIRGTPIPSSFPHSRRGWRILCNFPHFLGLAKYNLVGLWVEICAIV